MVRLNSNFSKLKRNYLFVEVQDRVKKYKKENSNVKLINMGIGDVTLPLSETVVKAMKDASDEMRYCETFRGYGPYDGYEFLKEAICRKYKKYGITINSEEVYVSDGAKSDVANILDLFHTSSKVLIADPVYPVYLDTNILMGNQVSFINATKENNFLPMPSNEVADIIYICSPNNPTGAVYNRNQLKQWVDFALKNNSLIIFDAAYEAFIEDPNLPHSIFEIEGARKCAIELCSFSKSAGFTGLRCGYAVIPNDLEIDDQRVGELWLRRQSIKFNGVSYITQRAAEASLSTEGEKENQDHINYYKRNATILSESISSLGLWNTFSKNSPYVWFEVPNGMTSWEFFDVLLEKAHIVSTPGSGFGECGKGFIRLSSFGSYDDVLQAKENLKKLKI